MFCLCINGLRLQEGRVCISPLVSSMNPVLLGLQETLNYCPWDTYDVPMFRDHISIKSGSLILTEGYLRAHAKLLLLHIRELKVE